MEVERDQLLLWVPVALGVGIAAWFRLMGPDQWLAFILLSTAVAILAASLLPNGRLSRAVSIAGLTAALGCALIWWRAADVAAPVLARPVVTQFVGTVEHVQPLPARGVGRVMVAPEGRADLPPRVRVNIPLTDLSERLTRGSRIELRARLMPPPEPAVPGAYDFARVAWFSEIGATGRALPPIKILEEGEGRGSDLRARLSAHIQSQVPGSAGGIASALATGDRGAISDADSVAMQRSGLAHLLSVSGLHVTAVTVAAMLIMLKLLALNPRWALRWRLPVIAAAAGAAAAIGYTLLTGADVPTVRSCIASLLVLLALSLGREALTLRLVAAGALIVLLLWPEALAGPSFQLSFAAVTVIIALHESPFIKRHFSRQEEGWHRRLMRGIGALLVTGIAVELTLMPIGMYHFHKQGLYGALANIIAIPLTTFIIMPAEAAALLLDTVGLGRPMWFVTEQGLRFLLFLAHTAASAPGAIASLPAMPDGAFALMIAGGIWMALWRSSVRWGGLLPLMVGAAWAVATPAPDLLVTGDGRHVAIRSQDGAMALLRPRAGDYMRSMLGENGGVVDALGDMAEMQSARCSPDLCMIAHRDGARVWHILATRSAYLVPWRELIALCDKADIVISERRLPAACAPKWLRLDREMLAQAGGISIHFASERVTTVRDEGAQPWKRPETVQPPFGPASERKGAGGEPPAPSKNESLKPDQ